MIRLLIGLAIVILFIAIMLRLFKSIRKPQQPYDKLTNEQRYALYFLLELFSSFATESDGYFLKHDAMTYLEKANWYLGLTRKEVIQHRSSYQDYNKLLKIIKSINNNKQALNYMVNNSYNLVLLADGEKRKKVEEIYYKLWEKELGYSHNEIRAIISIYRLRTEI
jgi:hypothetical protein